MTETVERTATGAILYDKTIVNQISDERFTPAGWPHAEAVAGALRSGGRGTTVFVGNVPRQMVLRHYFRGGLIGRVLRDTYLFASEDRTRSFREWRLLDKLTQSKLRVPRPAAARYCRRGVFYTADIITVTIPGVVALSQFITTADHDADFWHGVGASIHEFHDAGVYHADMNAYNLQIDQQGLLWMLDFDRGALKPPGAWQQATLARLHRSLRKVAGLDPAVRFRAANWEQLLEGYFNASRSA